jgi:hypothetical protein
MMWEITADPGKFTRLTNSKLTLEAIDPAFQGTDITIRQVPVGLLDAFFQQALRY